MKHTRLQRGLALLLSLLMCLSLLPAAALADETDVAADTEAVMTAESAEAAEEQPAEEADAEPADPAEDAQPEAGLADLEVGEGSPKTDGLGNESELPDNDAEMPEEVELNEANFPDAAFRGAVKRLFDKSTMVEAAELAQVTELDVRCLDIEDLTGIEYFTGLTELDCSENRLTALNLSKNTELRELVCNDNRIEALDLSANTALEKVYCYNNRIAALDVSACAELTCLSCSNNALEKLSVGANAKLTELYCAANGLTALDVSANAALDSLDFDYNQLTEIDLSANEKLTYLSCSGNRLTALELGANPGLVNLLCNDNRIAALDVSGCEALEELDCVGNEIGALDLRANSALEDLECGGNPLAYLLLPDSAEPEAEFENLRPVPVKGFRVGDNVFIDLAGLPAEVKDTLTLTNDSQEFSRDFLVMHKDDTAAEYTYEMANGAVFRNAFEPTEAEEIDIALPTDYILLSAAGPVDSASVCALGTLDTERGWKQSVELEVLDPEGEADWTSVVEYDADSCSVKAIAAGTVQGWVKVYFSNGDDLAEDRFGAVTLPIRIDVVENAAADPEEASAEITGVQLIDSTVSFNIYREDYAEISILPLLKSMQAGLAEEDEEEALSGCSVLKAEFADGNVAEFYDLQVIDDRTLAIVPKLDAIKADSRNFKKATKSAITIWFRDAESAGKAVILHSEEEEAGPVAVSFTTAEQLTLKPQTKLPSVKAAAVTINGDGWLDLSAELKFTGDALDRVDVISCPDRLTVNADDLSEDGSTLPLRLTEPCEKKYSGSLTLRVHFAGWDDASTSKELTVKVNVTPGQAPKLKFVSKLQFTDHLVGGASTAVQVTPAEYVNANSGLTVLKVTEGSGKKAVTWDQPTGSPEETICGPLLFQIESTEKGFQLYVTNSENAEADGASHSYKAYFEFCGRTYSCDVKTGPAQAKNSVSLSLTGKQEIGSVIPSSASEIGVKDKFTGSDVYYGLRIYGVEKTQKGSEAEYVNELFTFNFPLDEELLVIRDGDGLRFWSVNDYGEKEEKYDALTLCLTEEGKTAIDTKATYTLKGRYLFSGAEEETLSNTVSVKLSFTNTKKAPAASLTLKGSGSLMVYDYLTMNTAEVTFSSKNIYDPEAEVTFFLCKTRDGATGTKIVGNLNTEENLQKAGQAAEEAGQLTCGTEPGAGGASWCSLPAGSGEVYVWAADPLEKPLNAKDDYYLCAVLNYTGLDGKDQSITKSVKLTIKTPKVTGVLSTKSVSLAKQDRFAGVCFNLTAPEGACWQLDYGAIEEAFNSSKSAAYYELTVLDGATGLCRLSWKDHVPSAKAKSGNISIPLVAAGNNTGKSNGTVTLKVNVIK